MSTLVSPGSVQEALQMVHVGLGYLAAADATALAAGEQARCLHGLEQATSVLTAARSFMLGAFTVGQGYCSDAEYSARAWLIHQTGITKGAAVGYTAWARRVQAHPQIGHALADRRLSESFGRTIGTWTDKLPEDCREAADEILLAAAAAGMGLRDLAGLFAEIYERSRPQLPDEDPGRAFEDRAVRLETTFDGAGVLTGDLTPQCAAVVGAVLDALSAPAGAGDTRSQAQRCHDALQEAMQRLLAAGLLPERAGQPVKALLHISLADLMRLDGSSAMQEEWTAQVRAAWAAHRAAASVSGSDGGAWLDGEDAAAIACDAAMTPIVTGEVNPAALEDLVRLCVQFDKLRHGADRADDTRRVSDDPDAGLDDTGRAGDSTDAGGLATPTPNTTPAWEALEQAIIGKAVDLVSGPGGLASFLRRRQLGARLGGPSLPLDVGVSRDIPAAIRRAVILRDQHCRFPNGCDQPAAACEVHHLTHKANGGKTSVSDCALFCFHHHQVTIHQQGWTVVLNPDGTTTAWNKDKTKVLRSHGPPARPG
jgi:hypothetical protein